MDGQINVFLHYNNSKSSKVEITEPLIVILVCFSKTYLFFSNINDKYSLKVIFMKYFRHKRYRRKYNKFFSTCQ